MKRPDEKGKENLADKLLVDAKLSVSTRREVAQQGRLFKCVATVFISIVLGNMKYNCIFYILYILS